MKTSIEEKAGSRMPSVGSVDAVSYDAVAEVRTREAVVQLLLAHGPLTAAALAERIGFSSAAIRRHLEQLLAEGAVISREASTLGRRGRGRPARTYLLTEIGRTRLPHSYDALAIEALEFLSDVGGPDAVATFARRRAEGIVDGVRGELAAAVDVPAKAEILARALTGAGFAASVQEVGIGQQLCQHHCPVAHVATRFPQLCEEEMTVITQVLGTYAQRLATIARGDSFCTTFIPAAHQPHQLLPLSTIAAAAPNTASLHDAAPNNAAPHDQSHRITSATGKDPS
ncbi:putative ArsR family transcriptional regulator [Nakamurella sp. UYEF19]|uniref:helix-turn-helix transcriptional regulator n=1 Tax=Nakamurella sp. UYEF19 TaxID=1756392 RepID=UPI0033982F0A